MAVVQLSQLACASTRHTGDDSKRPPATAILVYPGGFLRAKCAGCLTLFLNYHAAAGLTRWDYGVFPIDQYRSGSSAANLPMIPLPERDGVNDVLRDGA